MVKIKDTKSVHGRAVIDVKLQSDQPRPIFSSDILLFGAEVRRGAEVFPPCLFYLKYEFQEWTS